MSLEKGVCDSFERFWDLRSSCVTPNLWTYAYHMLIFDFVKTGNVWVLNAFGDVSSIQNPIFYSQKIYKPHSSSTISFQANRSLRASTSLPAITKANFCASLPENFNCCHFHVFRSFRPLEYGNSVTFWSGFGDYSSPPLVEPFETQKLRPVGHCGQETIKVC